MDSELKWKIYYYGRNKFYQTMQSCALEGVKKFPNDVAFRLYSGYALALLGRFQEAIRNMDNLHNIKEVSVGATLALIYAHKNCQTVDRETVQLLEENLKTERKSSEGLGLYHAALLFFFQNKIVKSREYLTKFLKQNDDVDGMCLKGWLEIANENIKAASSCFKIALEKDKKHLDAFLGLVKVKELEGNFVEGLALLNQVIAKNMTSVLPLIEKSRLLLSTREWEQALETASRALAMNTSSVDAHTIKILITICREGNFNEAAIHLNKLLGEVDKYESKNAGVYVDVAQLFGSIACRQPVVLNETYRFAEKAVQLEPGNSAFMAELGFQHLYLGNTKEASRCFKNATKLDDSSILGLTGLTMCQILGGTISEQIKQQVDFLREVQSENPTPELLFMAAKIAVSSEDAAVALDRAAMALLRPLENVSFGVSYIRRLNVDLLMQIVRENMVWASKSRDATVFYQNCGLILGKIRDACPGLLEPQLEFARTQYLLGNLVEANDILMNFLDFADSRLADAHVLMAQINLKQKNYIQAARSLENSLSHNFQIKEHPLYHLAAAMVHKQTGNLVEVVKSLKTAMASPTYQTNEGGDEGPLSLSLADKATINLELVQALMATQKIQEAEVFMRTALERFKGTSEEGRVYVANAKLTAEAGNVKAAIEGLQRVDPGESYYSLARTALAEIYLERLKNREMYAQCFQDLVKVVPSKETFEMLGDAYTSIQDPDAAIAAYEEALKFDETNSDLICKMGKSLVKTHFFTKAINYYKEAVKKNSSPQLIYDMAQLYFKLGQLDNAERILVKHTTENKIDYTDARQIMLRTRLLQLLAKVRDKSGSLTDSLASLREAKENHCKMDKRALSQSDQHKAIVVDICVETALLLTRLRDFNGAIRVFKEALNYRPNDTKVLAGLAKLHMQIGNIEECQAACQHLISTDADSEPAAIMLADISFRKMDLDTAAHHLKLLLAGHPDYWTALARLIEVMRRLGKLEEANSFIQAAEDRCQMKNNEAGLFYCRGLYNSYNSQPQIALTNFNRARGDPEWGEPASYNMIDICLNPAHDILGGEDFHYEILDNELPDAKENALKTAKRLLMQVTPRKGSEEETTHRLLENFWLLATRQKANVDKALQDLVEMMNDDFNKDHIGISLGVATAFMLQKQVQKARNHLKRMVKTQWRFEDAEYLERSWLLLADIYIQGGKTDLAADVIQRVLEHNKSCYKAYEYAGYIAEKEQLYNDAALQYELAWRYSGRSNPAVGFKLAFNYMKAKSYADAIDTCHAVLSLTPNYPRIRKEILEKSRNHLRT